MKELEKTKRISIASVLFILVILIALLAYKRPKHLYSENTKSTLEKITTENYFTNLTELKDTNVVLIDVRSQFDFEKGHLENAVNIYAPEILNDTNSKFFDELKKNNNSVILYGNTPNEVIAPYMLLYQLGYKNIKILTAEITYSKNKVISKDVEIEKSKYDINGFIQESIKKASIKAKPKPEVVKTPKKIIPIKKKKKLPVEGGC
ncbi:rhodanese-like domain-containing protein [Lutibacter flavus]|uniref:Rhodanese-related sulfurtransferase n=1 Tax=Lutibacter flavus TaxID=691689 RepID=A0A238V881_9FLAO|nr:rhodanese-like domain-containing protein [Lutibacter flavus]SNR30446.1 Rhodanese-related sulfurtransferase [Lutibacter flavus]